MLKINGVDVNAAGQTVESYLESIDYNPQRVAVEKNGEIVPKATFKETLLKDGDVVEIVSFVGGG